MKTILQRLLFPVLISVVTLGLSARAEEGIVNDGPHLFVHDSLITVIYVCAGELMERHLPLRDTVRFAGLCHDSATTYVIPTGQPKAGPETITGVTRIFAVSDIHGEYRHLTNLLINAGVIDSALHWSWDDGHLVIDGDVFDRGPEVTEILWLVYRLEQEAVLSGGMVHFTLGNHEAMVLQGDLRYLNEKYSEDVTPVVGVSYDDQFGPETVLGRWLRTKHVVVKLNDILFVHAGISPETVSRGYSLSWINQTIRNSLDISRDSIKTDEVLSFLFRGSGPLWYRRFMIEYKGPQINDNEFESILEHFDAKTIVVGHTEMDSVVIQYDGRLIGIDVPVEDLGCLNGLLWEGGLFYRVDGDGQAIRIH